MKVANLTALIVKESDIMVILDKWREPRRRETFTPYYLYIDVPLKDIDKYCKDGGTHWMADYQLFGRRWCGRLEKALMERERERFGFSWNPKGVKITLVWPSAANHAYLYMNYIWD